MSDPRGPNGQTSPPATAGEAKQCNQILESCDIKHQIINTLNGRKNHPITLDGECICQPERMRNHSLRKAESVRLFMTAR
jgi:hypothetical protein